MNKLLSTSLLFALISLFAAVGPARGAALEESAYRLSAGEMSVILLDINWGRAWACGGYLTAQIERLRFEHLSPDTLEHDNYTEIFLDTPSNYVTNDEFINLGFLVKPGYYVLTEWVLRVVRPGKDATYLSAGRDQLVGDGAVGGVVKVEPGEVVYIGNYFIKCDDSPVPWRYYTEGRENFRNHVIQYQDRYGFISDREIRYRLLDTELYGVEYRLE